jgi:signal transduction histidine kinase
VFNKEDINIGTPNAKFYEIDTDGSYGQPFVLYPILADDGTRQVLGVIRCVNHQKPKRGPIQDRPLALDLQPLEFVAQQIAPVLQSLETRIQRERSISTIKHDLFSPINMIRSTTDAILADFEKGLPGREYDIKDLGASSALIRNLVAQLDPDPSEPVAVNPKPTYIMGDILARVVNMLRPYAYEERQMQIEYIDIEKLPRMNVDRALIERAIHNLLVNAVKYGKLGSTIIVRGREARAGYCLDVENEGIGIEQQEVAFIGVPGYRSPRAREVAMGIGLGLAITRGAMESHGGKLFVTRPDSPTIMTLFFPRTLAVDSRR